MQQENSTTGVFEETRSPRRRGALSTIQGSLTGLILLVLIPFLLSEAYFFYDRYEYRRDVAIQENLEVARAVAKNFGTFIQDVLHAEFMTGLAITSSQPITEENRSLLLDKFRADNPAVRSVAWFNPQGIMVAADQAGKIAIGVNARDRTYLQEILAGRDWSVSELIKHRVSGKIAFTINRAIRNEQGELLGVVSTSIDPERLDSVLGIDRVEGRGVSLIDNKGMMVYRYPHIELTWEERNWLRIFPSLFGEALSGKENVKSVLATHDGKMRLAAAAPIPSLGWVAGSGQWEEEALGPIVSNTLKGLGVVLLVALASFAAAFMLSRKLAAAIGTLQTHALSLGRGEYDSRVYVSGPEELRDLAGVFNGMAEEIVARESERTEHLLRIESELGARKQAEEALKESGRKYRELVQNANSAIIRWRRDGIITFFNEYAQTFFGYREDEVIGKHLNIIVPEIESNGVDLTTLVQDIVDHPGRYAQNLNENIGRDGRRVWMAWTNKPIFDERGMVAEILSIGTDMTERIRAEQALRDSEERFRLFMDNSPSIAWIKDEKGRYIYFNKTCEDRFEVLSEDWQGKTDFDLWPAETAEQFEKNDQAVLESGLPVEITEETINPDASRCTWWVFKFPFRDSSGKPYVGGVGVDLTERKLMEEELHRRRIALERAQRIARMGNWEWDVKTGKVEWSGALYDIFGLEPQEPSYELARSLVHPDDLDLWECAVTEFIYEDKPFCIDYRAVRPDGTAIWIHNEAEIMRDAEGKAFRIFGTAQDITGRKRAEEALRRQNLVLGGAGRILREALTCDTEEELGRICLEVAEEVTSSRFGFIGEINTQGMLAVIAISDPGWGACRMEDPIGRKVPRAFKVHGIYGRVLLGGKGFFTNGPDSYRHSIGTPEGHPPLQAFLGTPLIQDGKTIGMVGLGNREGGYTQEQQQAMEMIAPAIVQALLRKRAEAALRDSEEKIRAQLEEIEAIYKSAPVGMCIFDRDLRYLRVNDRLAEINGIPVKDHMGKRARDIVPDLADLAEELAERIFQTGEPELNIEFSGTTRSQPGVERIWLEQWLPLKDPSGEVIGINVVAEEITERKRMEEDLRELSQRLSYHVDNSPLAVIEWGPDMRLSRWSGTAEHMFGWRADEVLGKRMEDFRWIYEEDQAQVAEVSADLKAGTNPQRFSANCNYRKDGSVVQCEWYNSSLLDDSGNLRSILSLVLDVTERKQAEEALWKAHDELEERVTERTAELASANEELRAIPSRLISAQEEERKRLAIELHDSVGQTLAALKFRIESVMAARDRGDPQGALGQLEGFVPILQRSIDETRAIYMGLRPTVLEDLGLLAAIQWFCRELGKLQPERHIEIEMDIAEKDIPELLKLAIFRIVQEGLNNVTRHSKAEWVDLSLAKNGNRIDLTIQDDGIGMDLDYILETQTARSLGLTGMRERAELTGGTFSIESMIGEGTTVRASWPFVSASN